MVWHKDVEEALKKLGGQAHLSDIYDIVLKRRRARGDTIGEYKAWVRYVLQNNSRGRGHDIFEPKHLGTGIWQLKD